MQKICPRIQFPYAESSVHMLLRVFPVLENPFTVVSLSPPFKDLLTALQPQLRLLQQTTRLTFPGPTFRTFLYLFIVFSLSNSLVTTHSQLQLGTAGDFRPRLTEGYAGKLHFAKTKRDFR